jgi:MFS family permease
MLRQVSNRGHFHRLTATSIATLQKNGKLTANVSRNFSQVPDSKDQTPKKSGFFSRLFGPESNIASEKFKNRWAVVFPIMAGHACIGSPYAWSLMGDVITRQQGFVCSAAADWTLMQTALPLSILFAFHGLSASVLGKWQLKVGPRLSVASAAVVFGGALSLAAFGIHTHTLPLVYIGYGVLGGIGMGLGYTPPVQTLLQWFPDRKGLASGMAIAAFGSGALLFAPCVQYLMKQFHKLPQYLGAADQFITKTIDGKLFADVNGQLIEVVNATTAELSKLSYSGLSEGLYVVGTGSTGAAEALAVMGLSYFAVMMSASLAIKNPHPSYQVAAPVVTNAAANTVAKVAPVRDLTVEETMKTSQFYLMGVTFFCLATGGMGLFSVAKPMMSEVFSNALPALVTSSFAASYVLMLSMGNLGGRLGWALISDQIGRQKTFQMFTLGCIPVYFALPTLVSEVIASGSNLPLYLFCGGTMFAISGMGGAFALLPAYEADLFGTKNMGAIHGRMLLFSSSAGLVGPYMLLKLRSISEQHAIQELLTKVNPETFAQTFGVSMDQAGQLLAAKTLNIAKLLALAPPGTVDPSPHLYDSTMYTLSGMMVVAFLAHNFVKPLPANFGMPKTIVNGTATEVKKVEEIVETTETKDEKVGDRQVK